MRTLLSCLTIIFLAISCGSVEQDQKRSGDVLSDIENSDFMPEKTVSYIPKTDAFKGDVSNYDSTSKESINRLPEPKLEKIAEGNDPIDSGISYCYRGRYDLAFKVFDKAYEKYKSHPGYWNQIGSCYLIQNNYRKALLYYNKALGVEKDYAPAINNFGVLYLKQGKDQLAIEAFTKASKMNSFSLTPMFNLAHLYLKYGALSKANAILNVLYKKNKEDVDVLSALGSYNLMVGNPANAVRFYEQIDDNQLHRADISLNYAYALRLVGKKDDARDLIKKLRTKNLKGYENYYLKVKQYVEN